MGILDLAAIRKDYALSSLTERDVDADPIRQFERWFADALSAQVLEPNAMTLATATRDGHPSADAGSQNRRVQVSLCVSRYCRATRLLPWPGRATIAAA